MGKSQSPTMRQTFVMFLSSLKCQCLKTKQTRSTKVEADIMWEKHTQFNIIHTSSPPQDLQCKLSVKQEHTRQTSLSHAYTHENKQLSLSHAITVIRITVPKISSTHTHTHPCSHSAQRSDVCGCVALQRRIYHC